MDLPVCHDHNAYLNQVLKENEARYASPQLQYSNLSLLNGGQLQHMFSIRNLIKTEETQSNLTKVASEKCYSNYSCKICDRSFTNKRSLEVHERLHIKKRPYKCPHCDKSFSSSSGIRVHIRKHTGERPYLCPYCDKRFSDPSIIRDHIRTHTGERPHQCPHCDKTFIKRSHILQHIRQHTGERPHKCDYCDKTFTQLGALQRHTRRHTGERPFKCHYCENSFIRQRDLDRHLLTHTEDRSFQCGGCLRRFTTRFHFTIHACPRDGWRNNSLKYTEYQPVSCNLALPICFPPEQTEPYDLTMGTNAAAAV